MAWIRRRLSIRDIARGPKEQVWAQLAQQYLRYSRIPTAHAQTRSRDSSWKNIMVRKQCPLLRPTFWYLICCATCLGSRDNSKYHTDSTTHIGTHITEIGFFHRLFDSGYAPSTLSLRLNSWSHAWHDSDGGNVVNNFFLRNCLSSKLRVFTLLPVLTFIFALSATYFGIFARRALVRSRTPMIICLSIARSGDLHFATTFVVLDALVREIIANLPYIPTYQGCGFGFGVGVGVGVGVGRSR